MLPEKSGLAEPDPIYVARVALLNDELKCQCIDFARVNCHSEILPVNSASLLDKKHNGLLLTTGAGAAQHINRERKRSGSKRCIG